MKLADGKGVGGQGRLSDHLIDQMQNYYGYAIRNNSGQLDEMKNAIWAILYHSVKSSDQLEMQYRYCPKDDWCKF